MWVLAQARSSSGARDRKDGCGSGWRAPWSGDPGGKNPCSALSSSNEKTEKGVYPVLFPASEIRVRDQWIGWSRPRRAQNLPWVINNSRLLIFPWVRIDHLGSHVLGQLARRVQADWLERWGYGPLLMESFVDPKKFCGMSYQTAGWIKLGTTTGRGLRRATHRYQSTPKLIYVKALADDFRERLCGGPLPRRGEP
jgi:hypothetical protein